MKYIKKEHDDSGKCIGPENFTRWKELNAESLLPFYDTNNAKAAWSYLASSQPEQSDEGIFYYSKDDLKDELLKEQGYLCCYCNRIIHNDEAIRANSEENIDFNDRRCTIEHVVPKSDNAEQNTFDYCNLAVSCSGGERIPQSIERYCNSGRGEKSLTIEQSEIDCDCPQCNRGTETAISVTPFDPVCEEIIYFSIDGGVHSDCKKVKKVIGYFDENATQYSGILNLINFNDVRAAKIKPYFFSNWAEYVKASELHKHKEIGMIDDETEIPPIPELEVKDKFDALRSIDALLQKDENERYEEFCTAIISVLKRDIVDIIE